MPQVQLNTRIDIATHTDLHAYAKATGKPIARIVEEAILNYLKEASPVQNQYPVCTLECGHEITWGESTNTPGASLPHIGLVAWCPDCESDQEIVEIV